MINDVILMKHSKVISVSGTEFLSETISSDVMRHFYFISGVGCFKY